MALRNLWEDSEGVQLLRDGIIGDELVAKAWNIQRRRTTGKQKPSDVPVALDYDLWTGPVPMLPYQENRVDGWPWWHHYGSGDMGNDGIHDLEYARWGLGVATNGNKTLMHMLLTLTGAVRNDRRANADIELVHMTATLCHLGSIAT